ncbi:hypothetical protein [Saccharopolyspora sp. NPDC002686]|uniref:hypothetical protein n=1 Tax=Saccharopolyspora sp. NPDC002686 TaxID=3154541 RepID=UPI0033205054
MPRSPRRRSSDAAPDPGLDLQPQTPSPRPRLTPAAGRDLTPDAGHRVANSSSSQQLRESRGPDPLVATAALSGVPIPGFGAALSYYDSLAAKRLPAALVQGQRDYFGAHTYHRIDEPGTFHTRWSDNRTETTITDH